MSSKQPQCTACGMGDSYSFSLDINKLGCATKILNLRDHAARNLNFCCTLFLGVCFRFWGKGPMYTEPCKPSNRLLGVETVTKQIG